MRPLSYSPKAAKDIDAIWDYSAANWGADQADAYTDAIRDMCRALASRERAGRMTNLRADYRKCPCGSHVIWYRDRGNRLEIIRILHAAQDTERHLHD